MPAVDADPARGPHRRPGAAPVRVAGDAHSGERGAALRSQRGQSTVELALCLPLLTLVFAAVVEIGMLASDQSRLWHAARAAARVAAVDPDPAEAREAAEEAGLDPVEISIAPGVAYRRQGEAVTVSLAYAPHADVPLIGAWVERLTLRAGASMRIEQP